MRYLIWVAGVQAKNSLVTKAAAAQKSECATGSSTQNGLTSPTDRSRGVNNLNAASEPNHPTPASSFRSPALAQLPAPLAWGTLAACLARSFQQVRTPAGPHQSLEDGMCGQPCSVDNASLKLQLVASCAEVRRLHQRKASDVHRDLRRNHHCRILPRFSTGPTVPSGDALGPQPSSV